jgi:RNA polymerase sigma-70 factor (ECF subfamily)
LSSASRQKFLLFRNNHEADALDDREIVRICLKENSEAFEWIVGRYRDTVFWTAYHLVLDYEDARDVAQQCFLKVWHSLNRYDPEKSFRSWITKIAANCAIDFLRGRKQSDPLPELSVSPEPIERSQDIRKIFIRVAPLLSEKQRIVLVLREIEGMDFSEIAGMLHCTESTVRNLLSQAKESFRKKTKEFFPEYGL